MTIVDRLKDVIDEKRVVKKDLASSIGVAQSTLSTWLDRGEDFPARFLIPICNVLNISPYRLLTGEDVPVPVAEIPDDFVQVSADERFLLETVRNLDREGMIVVTSEAIKESRRVRTLSGNGIEGRIG